MDSNILYIVIEHRLRVVCWRSEAPEVRLRALVKFDWLRVFEVVLKDHELDVLRVDQRLTSVNLHDGESHVVPILDQIDLV